MNNLRKIFFSLFYLLAIIPYGISQNVDIDKKKSSMKPFYAFETNFGITSRREMSKYHDEYDYYERYNFLPSTINYADNDAKLFYKTLVYGANFTGGFEFKHYLKAGLGLGYLYYKQATRNLPYIFDDGDKTPLEPPYILYPDFTITHGIPLFLYLRSDFLDKKISPYMDFKIGNNFLITKETVNVLDPWGNRVENGYGKFRLKNGLFVAANIGVSFKANAKTAVNISVGYQYMSRNYDYATYHSFSDVSSNQYYKTEYIIVDHQFLLNLGISF
jgi:hypothetical protein